jgi:hypothetical protein
MEKVKIREAKVYDGLYKEFAKIAHLRFINGLDKRPSPPLVQKKALKHPLWGKIKSDLEIAKFLEDGEEK